MSNLTTGALATEVLETTLLAVKDLIRRLTLWSLQGEDQTPKQREQNFLAGAVAASYDRPLEIVKLATHEIALWH